MTSAAQKSPSERAAAEIYQRVLDELSDAVLNYDPKVLTERVAIPFRMSTNTRDFVIESTEDWLDSVLRFGQNLTSMGVNHFIRLVTDAEFLSENYILGHHVTHSLCNAVAMVPPYENRTTLSRRNGVWRITEMDCNMENNRWPIAMARVKENTEPRWKSERAEPDARRLSVAPTAIYQDYLNALSRINMEDDFDAWCAHCDFPHTIHMDEVDQVIEGPDQIRPFFDMLRNQMKALKIDRFDRHVEHAEFLSATQICGYHHTNLSSKGDVKLGPVASRYILNRTGTQWRMVSVTNSLSNAEFPYARPEPSELLVSLRDIQERTTRQ
ncbi:MAG: hypothetical protein AAGA08_18015 [Pseudomonadota bacterium]